MSCCISSAVCCSFVTAAMSGIALGYNYSLAEYIDLKETNVSVYIKRGVFDDEIADDMDWRRSGHLPIAGHIGENHLMTGPPAEDDALALRSGRRLEDSMFESNDQNKFEGSLMKLTARAPYGTTTTKEVTSDQEMSNIISKYPLGSIDQLKAIQGLINMRKSGDARDATAKETPKSSTYGFDERYLPHFPAYPDNMAGGRRRMPGNLNYDTPPPANLARKGVPDESINEPAKWMFPKLSPEDANKVMYGDYERSYAYPPPVTVRSGPLRPMKTTVGVLRVRPTATTVKKVIKTTSIKIDMGIPKSIDRDLETFKDKLMLGKYEAPGVKEEDFMRMEKGDPIKSEGEDYDENIKGLPVRRRREVDPPNTDKDKIFLAAIKDKIIMNSEQTSTGHIDIKLNAIEENTLISKIMIISSSVAKVPTYAVSKDSRNMDVAMKQTGNRNSSVISTENTLEKLWSPKGVMLDISQSTVA